MLCSILRVLGRFLHHQMVEEHHAIDIGLKAISSHEAVRALCQVYEAIQEELAGGGRAYIICPLVGESSAKGFTDTKVTLLAPSRVHELNTMSRANIGTYL